MKIGYARTSTLEQVAGFEAQIQELEEAGCEKIFREQVSSVAERKELEDALEFIREGDTLVVTRLDRLARSVRHLGEICDLLEEKKAALQIINLGIDTGTASGKLVLNLLGAIAQFEREMMLERQREGIAKAQAEGKYRGRAPTAMAQMAQVLELDAQNIGPTRIAREIGISRSSVYRILNKAA